MVKKGNFGFTLIELLIVVAIIAILAAIAIPNFLAAQTRSKVSRVRGELKSVTTGLESYYVDNTSYPLTTGYPPRLNYTTEPSGILPRELSTPVAYLTRVDFKDPFKQFGTAPDEEIYTFHNIAHLITRSSNPTNFWIPARDLAYGEWRMCSIGPDATYWNSRTYMGWPHVMEYDPTNGTVSMGNIWRSQKQSGPYEWRGTGGYWSGGP